MATPIEVSFELPVSSQQGFKLVTDKAALETVLRETESIDPKVEILPHSDGSTQIRISRGFEGEWPSVVSSLVGDVIRVSEIRQWLPSSDDQNFSGTLEIKVDGQPVSMAGSINIFGQGDHCKVAIHASVKADIFLVGGTIEKVVQSVMIKGIEAEADILRDYLSRNSA